MWLKLLSSISAPLVSKVQSASNLPASLLHSLDVKFNMNASHDLRPVGQWDIIAQSQRVKETERDITTTTASIDWFAISDRD